MVEGGGAEVSLLMLLAHGRGGAEVRLLLSRGRGGVGEVATIDQVTRICPVQLSFLVCFFFVFFVRVCVCYLSRWVDLRQSSKEVLLVGWLCLAVITASCPVVSLPTCLSVGFADSAEQQSGASLCGGLVCAVAALHRNPRAQGRCQVSGPLGHFGGGAGRKLLGRVPFFSFCLVQNFKLQL